MEGLYIWAMILTAMTFHCIGATVRERLYIQTFDTSDGADITTAKGSSAVDCGALCFNTASCERFSYNAMDKKCWISSDTLRQETTGGVVRGEKCPSSKGFETYQLGSGEHCLKAYLTGAPFVTAEAQCIAQGAQLFIVESVGDLVYLAYKGMASSWIYQQNWNTAPWTAWIPSWPRFNECIWASPLNYTKTHACFVSFKYVCEIEM